jgi:hypothetical protein
MLWRFFYQSPPPAELSSSQLNSSQVSFLALGDQGSGGLSQWQVAEAMQNAAEKQGGIDFVLLLGDNFYGDPLQSVHDKQWNYKFENMYTGKNLSNIPFYAILGNHDYASEKVELWYDKDNMGSGRWKMPGEYYRQDFGEWDGRPLLRVVFINTNLFEPEKAAKQTAFIRDAYSSRHPKPLWRIVAGHFPLRNFGKHGDTKLLLPILLPVLQESRVDLYLAAHDHDQQLIVRKGEPGYIISGGGGQNLYQVADPEKGLLFSASDTGFVKIDLDPEFLRINFYSHNGKIEKGFMVQRSCRRGVSACMQEIPEPYQNRRERPG